MEKPNRSALYSRAVVVLLVIIAAVCRLIGNSGFHGRLMGLLRSAIYFGLFFAWGAFARRRIIQTQVQRYLTAVTALMMFWMALRTLKYYFIPSDTMPDLVRQVWYWYYCPMMFLPLLILFIAMSLGKPEDYRLPRWTWLLYAVTAVLLVLVVTNDLHQTAFVFPPDTLVWSDHDYGYGFGYWFVIAWELFCILAALITMLVKCRIPRSKKMLWILFLHYAAAVMYGVLYIAKVAWLKFIAGDFTVGFNLFFISIFESCIRYGLIQSNTHYGELFTYSTLCVQITNRNDEVLLASATAAPIAADRMRQAKEGPVYLDGGMRLSGADIQGGRVLWTEDISELLEVLGELRDTKESLEDSNSILQEEYQLKAREEHVIEQDKLYNMIQQETERQIDLLVELTDEFEKAKDEEKRKKLLGKMIVIGAYLKRRSNLIFLAAKTPMLSERELVLTFGESLSNLELFGVSCGFHMEVSEPVAAVQIMKLYDFFEKIVENSLDSMQAVTVRISKRNEILDMTINTDADHDFSDLAGDSVTAECDEDGEWRFSMQLYPGDEML